MEGVPLGGWRAAAEERQPMWFDLLPGDVWWRLLSNLSHRMDVLNLRAVSHRWDRALIDRRLAEGGLLDGNGGDDVEAADLQVPVHLEVAEERVPEELSTGGRGTALAVPGENGEIGTVPRFPDEILEMILVHLTLLDDLRTAVNSHKDWKRVLDPKRHLWLFPKVFPFLTKYLGRNQILSLRHVCSQWLQGVDEHIENAENLAPYNSNNRDLRIYGHRSPVWKQADQEFPYRFVYDSNRDKTAFEPDPDKHRRHAFFGREMTLVIRDSSTCESQRPALLDIDHIPKRFFGTFGQLIYYLNLEFPEETNYWKITHILQVMYRNLPNLRQLRIESWDPFACPCAHCQTLDTSASLEASLACLQLPSLKTLQLEYNVSGPIDLFPLEDILIRKHCATLGRLELKRWDHRFWQSLQWSQLKELCLTIETPGANEKGVLLSLAQLEAPRLARLSLTFRGEIGKNQQELFQVIQQFPGLQSLGILLERGDISKKEMMQKDTQFWLKFLDVFTDYQAVFPLIKILELKPAPIPLELIQHFPNVEALTIPGQVEVAPVRFTIWDFTYDDSKPWEFRRDPDSPNGMVWMNGVNENDASFFGVDPEDDCQTLPKFWLHLPRLNVFTVGKKIYRRQVFERFAQRFQRLTLCDYPSVFSSLFHLNMPNVTEVELQLGFPQGQGPLEGRRYYFKLLAILANLPNLERLELNCIDFDLSTKLLHIPEPAPPQNNNQDEEEQPSLPIMFPSVTHLKVNFSPISKGFLLRFPNLKSLEFDALTSGRKFCENWEDPILYEKYEPTTHPLQSAHQPCWPQKRKGILDSEVWNLLPSLELIKMDGGKTDGAFSRDVMI